MAKKEKKKVDTLMSAKELAKRYPTSMIASDIEDINLRIPSRSLAINYQTGGGVPYGKIMELYGEESSGKTLMALDYGYSCQQLGGIILMNDAEQSFTKPWAEANGLDLSRIALYQETRVEWVSDWIADMSIYWRSRLTNNEPILLIQDSMAAWDCLDNINSKMVDAKADMGNRAKAIYKMFRIRNELLTRLGISQIYVNQLRKNLKAGLFEDPDTTPGGNSMKYYASIRQGFYGGKALTRKIKGKERKYGKLTSIRIKKNKVAPPEETLKKFPIYNHIKRCDYIGFDRYAGLPDILVDLDIITKSSGGVFKYKGKTLVRGEENLLKLIEEDDSLRAKLIRKAGINTISNTRKQIESYGGKNLFPISGASYKPHTEEEDDEEDGF